MASVEKVISDTNKNKQDIKKSDDTNIHQQKLDDKKKSDSPKTKVDLPEIEQANEQANEQIREQTNDQSDATQMTHTEKKTKKRKHNCTDKSNRSIFENMGAMIMVYVTIHIFQISNELLKPCSNGVKFIVLIGLIVFALCAGRMGII